jgi:hypothetical protein
MWACGLALLLSACAATSEHNAGALMSDAAAECKARYPVVERFEIDSYGRVVAWFKETHSHGELDPFFACYRTVLEQRVRTASGTQTPAEPSAAPPGALSLPEWKVGHNWTFRWEWPFGSGTLVWRVAGDDTVAGVDCWVVTSGPRTMHFRKSDLAMVADTISGGSRFTPPRPAYVWPLYAGRRWEQLYTKGAPDGGRTQLMLEVWRAEAAEVVTVPAGRFDTLKVVSRIGSRGPVESEYWYSAESRNFVRLREHFPNGVRTWELIEFSVE